MISGTFGLDRPFPHSPELISVEVHDSNELNMSNTHITLYKYMNVFVIRAMHTLQTLTYNVSVQILKRIHPQRQNEKLDGCSYIYLHTKAYSSLT